jgi:hypothetical protein
MVKSRPGGVGNPVVKIPGKSVTLGGQRKSDDRARQVFGDGMRRRSRNVNQGDLLETRGARSLSSRSQSTHKSEEAG